MTAAIVRGRGNWYKGNLHCRSEVVDSEGRVAWTNPLFFES